MSSILGTTVLTGVHLRYLYKSKSETCYTDHGIENPNYDSISEEREDTISSHEEHKQPATTMKNDESQPLYGKPHTSYGAVVDVHSTPDSAIT